MRNNKYINILNISFYCLTINLFSEKVKNIKLLLKDNNITFVKSVKGFGLNTKQTSGSLGHMKMIDLGLKNQNNNIPFQPFIILEDDIDIVDDKTQLLLETNFKIPKQADIVYLGISQFGFPLNKKKARTDKLYRTVHDDDYYRIYNMASTHAILICTPRAASLYQSTLMESVLKPWCWDYYICKLHKYLNVYGLKEPIFYQRDVNNYKYTNIILEKDDKIVNVGQLRKNKETTIERIL